MRSDLFFIISVLNFVTEYSELMVMVKLHYQRLNYCKRAPNIVVKWLTPLLNVRKVPG
jgi:hypothetical protein